MSVAKELRGAVVILDALGTRGIWARGDPIRVAERLGKLTQAFKSGVRRTRNASSAPYQRLARRNGLEAQDVAWECQTISDTVIATARTKGSLGSLLLYVAFETIPLIATGFEAEHPFRGAISTGTFFESGSALIGPAIDEAADWHDKSDWAGVMLTPSAAIELQRVGKDLMLVSGTAYVSHKIPLKDGPFEGYALNWPLDTVPRHAIVSGFSRSPISTDVAKKMSRTLAFYDANHR